MNLTTYLVVSFYHIQHEKFLPLTRMTLEIIQKLLIDEIN